MGSGSIYKGSVMTGQNTTESVAVTVKAEIGGKGFGFLTDGVAGSEDIFMTDRMLRNADIKPEAVKVGATMSVDFSTRGDGKRRLVKVHSFDGKPVGVKKGVKKRQPMVQSTRELPQAVRATGRVKYYDEQKGFGFLEVLGAEHAGVKDIFFHVTDVPEEIETVFDVGTIFYFAVGEGKRGQKAIILEIRTSEPAEEKAGMKKAA